MEKKQISFTVLVDKVYDELAHDEKSFKKLNKAQLLKVISDVLEKMPWAVDKDELIGRIKGVLVLQAVAGILNDLTPEQKEDFDKATRRDVK